MSDAIPYHVRNKTPKTPLMADYLVNRCGFSIEKAKAASAELTHVKFLKNPVSVISFFERIGLEDTQIRFLISWRPKLLTASVGNTLEPKVKKRRWLKDVTDRIEKGFGLSRGSGKFVRAFYAITSLSKMTVDAKFRIFESFGWSKSDIVTAFCYQPHILALSEEKIRKGLDFFMNQLHYEPSYISRCPKFLMYSLECRVVPRHAVLMHLESNNLLKKNPCLYTLVCRTENQFLEAYVLPYKDEFPDVYNGYICKHK
ncbi:uncharacterized protein LOC143889598 [Tasmannia lanceolata]|uniref:uncharacterized protein LOC143889598 n=1 Tax=Tasmannia lanceolata TaxID=3420 RepID=UPI004062CB3B